MRYICTIIGELKRDFYVQGASRETAVFEIDITEKVDGVVALLGGN
jgi:hypothetical protein